MQKLTERRKSGTKFSKASIRGKQILVGGLVVLVAVAGYYRWSTLEGNNTTAVIDDETVPAMSTAKPSKDNYFLTARQDRDSARSEADELLSEIADDEGSTPDAKAEARSKITAMADNIKTEGEVESLIKADGYDDCIVFIDEEEIRIVVKADELDQEKVSRITNIVTSKTDFKPSQIVVSSHE